MPRKKTVPAPRVDGWSNTLTGIGEALRDKRRAHKFEVDTCADRQTLENLWQGDDMAARIVEIPPGEMMRNGFDIKITEAQSDAYSTEVGDAVDTRVPGVIKPRGMDTREISDALMARFAELGGSEKFKRALQYRRAYGGGAILLGVDDGQSPEQPLELDRIKSFRWMNVLTPRELVAIRYYSDPYSEKYGEPEIYQISAAVDASIDIGGTPAVTTKTGPAIAYVHESRIIAFPGIIVSDQHRSRRSGWGDSVFVRLMPILSDFQMVYASTAHLTTDMAQAVFKIKGLAEMMSMEEDAKIIARAQLLDMSRSVARAIVIDSQEEFERKQTPVAGLPELLERFEHRLAAAADMPVALLMGTSPSGLNANGDADIRFWYDHIKTAQHEDLCPRLERFFKVLMHSVDGPTKGVEPDDWCIEFHPLWQLTEKEKADLRKTQSDTDVAYINSGVLTPEEVAASRFGGAVYSTETNIDVEGRAQLASATPEAAPVEE